MERTTTTTPSSIHAADDLVVDLDLSYSSGAQRVVPGSHRPGTYLGSGDGTARGVGLAGTVRWDLSEHTGPAACEMFFSGVIETDDGATIHFDTSGYGLVPDPDGAPELWDVTASVRFRTDDPRYAWVAARPATWQGVFDMETYRHRYRISRAADLTAGSRASTRGEAAAHG